MAKRERLPEITSPIAVFKWPKLSEPDYGTDDYPKPDGEYSVRLVFDKNDPEVVEFCKTIAPHWEAAMAQAKEEFAKLPVATRKKLKKPTPNNWVSPVYDADTEEETDEIEIKVSMKARIEVKKGPKAGQVFEKQPAIFDAVGNPMIPPPSIWGGTTGRVRFQLSPYFIPATGACGLSLRLLGVQIQDLVSQPQQTAESMGFGTLEDGYVHQKMDDDGYTVDDPDKGDVYDEMFGNE
jgi:hypothetical protein